MYTDFLIIGAGVTGLSCASKLRGFKYQILEQECEIGGYCRTIYQDDFVWDYAGHFFHFSNPEIQKEFNDLLSSTDSVFSRKCTKICYKGNYIDYPFQYNIHQLPKAEFVECLVDLFSRPKGNNDNFQQMLYEKFGAGIANKFLIPYNRKLYACDLTSLDIDAMGRFFPYADPEEIVIGFKNKQKATYNDTFFYSKKGAKAFINKIAENINMKSVHLGTIAQRIDIDNKTVFTNKGVFHYKYLINTTPFPKLMDMVSIVTDNTFSSNKVLVFNLGFDSPSDQSDVHWIYYPDETLCFYRVGFYNNILKQDKMSLYVEIGLKTDENLDIPSVLERVLEDLKKVRVITNQNLISKNSVVMNPAYVHINAAASNEKEQISKLLQEQQVYTAGRYGNWTYCSIEDCILDAYNTVDTILHEFEI